MPIAAYREPYQASRLGLGHTRAMRPALRNGLIMTVGVGVGAAALLLWQRDQEARRDRESHTVTEAMRRVTRLSTVEMTISDWRLKQDEKALFGILPVTCSKTVAVFYRGTVAAGFDLDNGAATLDIDAVHHKIAARLPAPRLLYVDAPAPDLVVADGSLCNEVTPDDYRRLAGESRQAIERQALASGILDKARNHARDLLTEVARPLGYQLEATFAAPSPTSAIAERLR
jgi:hypothetical protein